MHQWNHLNIYSQLASVQRSLHDSADASLESPTGASEKKPISDGELKSLESGLAYLSRLSALEKLFTNLVNAASARTSALAECSASGAAGRLGSPLRHAWDWLQLVQRCTLLHLRDAAEYHQVSVIRALQVRYTGPFICIRAHLHMSVAAPGGKRAARRRGRVRVCGPAGRLWPHVWRAHDGHSGLRVGERATLDVARASLSERGTPAPSAPPRWGRRVRREDPRGPRFVCVREHRAPPLRERRAPSR